MFRGQHSPPFLVLAVLASACPQAEFDDGMLPDVGDENDTGHEDPELGDPWGSPLCEGHGDTFADCPWEESDHVGVHLGTLDGSPSIPPHDWTQLSHPVVRIAPDGALHVSFAEHFYDEPQEADPDNFLSLGVYGVFADDVWQRRHRFDYMPENLAVDEDGVVYATMFAGEQSLVLEGRDGEWRVTSTDTGSERPTLQLDANGVAHVLDISKSGLHQGQGYWTFHDDSLIRHSTRRCDSIASFPVSAVGANGEVAFSWTAYDENQGRAIYVGRPDGSGGLETELAGCLPRREEFWLGGDPTVAVDWKGAAHLCWGEAREDGVAVYAHETDDGWEWKTLGPNGACQLAADAVGGVHALVEGDYYTIRNGEPSLPQSVLTASPWMDPAMTVSPAGTVYVVQAEDDELWLFTGVDGDWSSRQLEG